jgi:DNA-binding GntR family transcriptional regulator
LNTAYLKTHSLVDLACEALKKDIATRKLIPGQKIIVRELSERYGVSETPIKQALNRLVTEGLVESIPRKGMRVKQIKWEDIEDIIEVRFMIETFCIKPALKAIQSTPEIKESFLTNLSKHKQIIELDRDLNTYFRHFSLDQEFHHLFVECSANKKIVQIHKELGTHVYMYHIYEKQEKSRMMEGLKEHEAIYNALIEQDEEKLLTCIRTHVLNSKNDMQNLFKKIEENNIYV